MHTDHSEVPLYPSLQTKLKGIQFFSQITLTQQSRKIRTILFLPKLFHRLTRSKSIEKFIRGNIDLSPKGIIDRFDLFNYTEYSANCVYGHFGNKDVPWERIGW